MKVNNKWQEWYAIPAYHGYYINKEGLVKKEVRTMIENSIVVLQLILTTKVRRGYLTVKLSKQGETFTESIHRLLALVFIPQVEGKPFINHRNGDKLCNDLSNLEWCTHQENVLHAYRLGLIKCKSKPVIDRCNGKIFSSVKEAAIYIDKKYNTVRNYLNGSNKNPTCLEYYNAVV